MIVPGFFGFCEECGAQFGYAPAPKLCDACQKREAAMPLWPLLRVRLRRWRRRIAARRAEARKQAVAQARRKLREAATDLPGTFPEKGGK